MSVATRHKVHVGGRRWPTDAVRPRLRLRPEHSVSAMVGVLAAARQPERFSDLILIGPSPRYIDDTAYVGGSCREGVDELLESLESNYLGWSRAMAPVIVGNADRPELGAELTESFCRTDPEIQKHFARTTFLSDNRSDLERVTTSLTERRRRDRRARACEPRAVGRGSPPPAPRGARRLGRGAGCGRSPPRDARPAPPPRLPDRARPGRGARALHRRGRRGPRRGKPLRRGPLAGQADGEPRPVGAGDRRRRCGRRGRPPARPRQRRHRRRRGEGAS